jgi:uncharacterized iron-regulated membrane protein
MMIFMRKLHKWLGLIVGLQMCIWLLSGLIMSLLDADAVSGDTTAAPAHRAESLPANTRIVEPETLLERHRTDAVHDIELMPRFGRWVWRVRTSSGTSLYDALEGDRIDIDERLARQIALDGYAGEGALRSAGLVYEPTLEARGHTLPMWRVQFDDREQTRFYVSAQDGRIVARRTDAWSVFDVFWMLHTMDYVGRDNFNTPWVIAFAFMALWLGISGVLLLIKSFAPRRT